MFEEPLVILIKLSDRLHNMRTVYVLKPDKQRAVAEETLEVCVIVVCVYVCVRVRVHVCVCSFVRSRFAPSATKSICS